MISSSDNEASNDFTRLSACMLLRHFWPQYSALAVIGLLQQGPLQDRAFPAVNGSERAGSGSA